MPKRTLYGSHIKEPYVTHKRDQLTLSFSGFIFLAQLKETDALEYLNQVKLQFVEGLTVDG